MRGINRYKYTDKSAIKQAIRNFPRFEALIQSALRPGTDELDRTVSCRRAEQLNRERDAVNRALQKLREEPYYQEAFGVVKEVKPVY